MYHVLGMTLNVLLSKSSLEISGMNDRLESIAFGPDMATAGVPVWAPEIMANPPPREWPVMARPGYSLDRFCRYLTKDVVSR
jgi:hypothetical protein